ncbi:MAG: Cof-type HAD-IIB family hydrolase [Bacteroidaceae bacterium]|nr:Cof-type HAD-IIB family hydrolase [Bacteroidaceae bacterium]
MMCDGQVGAHLAQSQYRLLALDVDGTLTRADGTISARTVEVVKRLQGLGMRLCIASGRPPYGIRPVAELLGMGHFGGYVIGFNGGILTDYATGETMYTASLPDEALPVVVECGHRPGHTMLTYSADMIYTENPSDRYVQVSHSRNGMAVCGVSDFLLQAPRPVPKCIITGCPCDMPALQREVSARLYGVADVYLSDAFFLEVVRCGTDKADALLRLMDHLGLTHDNLVAAGDGHNDMGMIRLAALGIAMGNAHPDVRQVADVVAPPAAEDGLAAVLEMLIAEQ